MKKNIKFKIESFQIPALESTFKYCLQIKPQTAEQKLALSVIKKSFEKILKFFFNNESFNLVLDEPTALAFFILHKNKEFGPDIENIFHSIHQKYII